LIFYATKKRNNQTLAMLGTNEMNRDLELKQRQSNRRKLT